MLLSASSAFALEIVVTLPPYVEGVKAISPPGTSVISLIKPGDDPDSTALNVSQIRRLNSADLVLSTGKMPFEIQLAERCQQDPKLRGKLLILFPKNDPAVKAVIGTREGDHFHSGDDPHTWMSTQLYRIGLNRVANRISQKWPAHALQTQDRLTKYLLTLDALDKSNKVSFAEKSGKTVLIFHPSLGYLCAKYQLHQLSIEQHGESPSGKYLTTIVAEAKKAQVKAVFTEVGGSNKQAKAVADALNIPVIPLSVMDPNYSVNLKIVVKRIADNI